MKREMSFWEVYCNEVMKYTFLCFSLKYLFKRFSKKNLEFSVFLDYLKEMIVVL